jgi:hypothetical protein
MPKVPLYDTFLGSLRQSMEKIEKLLSDHKASLKQWRICAPLVVKLLKPINFQLVGPLDFFQKCSRNLSGFFYYPFPASLTPPQPTAGQDPPPQVEKKRDSFFC